MPDCDEIESRVRNMENEMASFRSEHGGVMKVLNKRTDKIPADAVYIGRPSKWGNPYKITGSGVDKIVRAKVIENYRGWLACRLAVEPDFLEPLRGKDLVCWCSPKPCHGDVLLEFMRALEG